MSPNGDTELRALLRVADEVRRNAPTEPDWASIEPRVMEAFAREPKRIEAFRPTPGLRSTFGFALAAAAVLLAALSSIPETAPDAPARAALHIEGATVDLASLHEQDAIEAGSEGVRIRLGDRGQVDLAPGGRLVLSKAQFPLKKAVFSLERGAVDVEVSPRAEGGIDEVLAIDCAQTRVAVHGTVFRVERKGDEVLVGVTRGSVAVGPAGRTGITTGWLLVAPAAGAFSLDGARSGRTIAMPEKAAEDPLHAASPEPVAVVPALVPEPAPEVEAPAPLVVREPAITDAEVVAKVHACLKNALPSLPPNVVVASSYTLTLDENGRVVAGRFDPPLHPKAMACALVRGRFEGARGSRVIPIEYRSAGSLTKPAP